MSGGKYLNLFNHIMVINRLVTYIEIFVAPDSNVKGF